LKFQLVERRSASSTPGDQGHRQPKKKKKKNNGMSRANFFPSRAPGVNDLDSLLPCRGRAGRRRQDRWTASQSAREIRPPKLTQAYPEAEPSAAYHRADLPQPESERRARREPGVCARCVLAVERAPQRAILDHAVVVGATGTDMSCFPWDRTIQNVSKQAELGFAQPAVRATGPFGITSPWATPASFACGRSAPAPCGRSGCVSGGARIGAHQPDELLQCQIRAHSPTA